MHHFVPLMQWSSAKKQSSKLPRQLFPLSFIKWAHFHYAAQNANGMLWKIILPWDPNIPQYRLFQPCELNLCIFVSLEGATPRPSATYHTNIAWKLSFDSLHIQTTFSSPPVWPDIMQDLAVYILKGGGDKDCDDGGVLWWGAGYGAKWKHVIQDPLKRNLAQQKKGTHIIIKSSRGRGKTTNIIPAPLITTSNAHAYTAFLIFLQMTEKMRRLELRCICSLPKNDKMILGNFLILE